MKVVYMHDEEDVHAFVRKAAAHFAEHPSHWTFTDGDVIPGCLFGARWGAGNDCVLVFRLDEAFEPVIYGQVIR